MDTLLSVWKWIQSNWEFISGGIAGLLVFLGVIAELTPFDWDNKVLAFIRKIWAKVPVFSRNAATMGTGKPK